MSNANQIQFDRSVTPGAIPAAITLKEGALAINLKDRAVYTLDDNGDVILLTRNYDSYVGTTLHVDPVSYTLNVRDLRTEIVCLSANPETYTIDSDTYLVGDRINITRAAPTAGVITIDLLGAGVQFIVDGVPSGTQLIKQGVTIFETQLIKLDATRWLVKTIRI